MYYAIVYSTTFCLFIKFYQYIRRNKHKYQVHSKCIQMTYATKALRGQWRPQEFGRLNRFETKHCQAEN